MYITLILIMSFLDLHKLELIFLFGWVAVFAANHAVLF